MNILNNDYGTNAKQTAAPERVILEAWVDSCFEWAFFFYWT